MKPIDFAMKLGAFESFVHYNSSFQEWGTRKSERTNYHWYCVNYRSVAGRAISEKKAAYNKEDKYYG